MSEESQIEYVAVAAVGELPPGERLFIELNEEPVVVFNIAGNLYAIMDTCTHDFGPLGEGRVEGLDVVCPRHGARFDLQTGAAKTLPAVTPTPTFPVRVRDGQIEVGIPV